MYINWCLIWSLIRWYFATIFSAHAKVFNLKQTDTRMHSIKLSWQDTGNYPNDIFVVSMTSQDDPDVVFTATVSFFQQFLHDFEFNSADHFWLLRGMNFTCTAYATCNGTCVHEIIDPVSIPCNTAGIGKFFLRKLRTWVDHHKRNLPITKRHIWILWKLTKHTKIKKLSLNDTQSTGPLAL